MKFKTTKEELTNGVAVLKLYQTSNDDLKEVLSYVEPVAYIMGDHCKDCDVYNFEDYYVTSGYRNAVGIEIDSSNFKKEIEDFKNLKNDFSMKIKTKNNIAKELMVKILDYNFNKLK